MNRNQWNIILFVAYLLFVMQGCAKKESAYRWKNVALGGGGYVTGIAIHPAEKDLVYIRTDVGGAYRWNPQDSIWVQLLDWVSYEERNLYGIDGMALAPSNPDIVYLAAGMYPWGGRKPHDVLKSEDRGKTWRRTGLNKRFWGNGNQLRYAGECLAVSPYDETLVFAGTRYDGLWVSRDGAETWNQIKSIPMDSTGSGVQFIVFENETDLILGEHQTGLYRSDDGGQTWSLMPCSPLLARRLALASNEILYVSTTKGLYKFDGQWSDISPQGHVEYNALAVHPQDPDFVITTKRRGLDDPMFRSADGGKTWLTVEFDKHFHVPWWPENHFNAATAALVFDPHVKNKVWMVDWYGTWFTPDIRAGVTSWFSIESGHEEIVAFDLKCPPEGAFLLSGVADNDGFYHEDLDAYPKKKFGTPRMQDAICLAYCESSPDFVVRVGGRQNKSGGGYSLDGGKSWTTFPSRPSKADHGRIAVSASGKSIVWIPGGEQPFISRDLGKTWTMSTGAPVKTTSTDVWNWEVPLVSDRMSDRFYLYGEGAVYASDNGGLTWEKRCVLKAGGDIRLMTLPGLPDELWAATGEGLYRSMDGGMSFDRFDNVSWAHLIGYGKPMAGHNTAVYLYGTVEDVQGIFRSDDLGETWIRINDEQSQLGDSPNCMAGDRQTAGRVYVGTNGRGIFYGEPGN